MNYEKRNILQIFVNSHGIKLLIIFVHFYLLMIIYLTNFFRLLIQAGYDVNIKDYDGWTPLHAAAHWGKEEACRILVDNLCDMEMVNKVVRPFKCILKMITFRSIILVLKY